MPGRQAWSFRAVPAVQVADNVAVLGDALATPAPLTVGALLGWHRRLTHDATAVAGHPVGAWRDTLGRAGGSDPRSAVHVGVPAADIPAPMDDLLAFVGRDDLDAVTAAAIAHAQFETIRPFADGNGRIGRVLIGWVLSRRLDVACPPAVSLQLARDLGGYRAALAGYRQQQADAWVGWLADAVEAAADLSGGMLHRIAELQRRWRAAVADLRADAAGRRLCEELPAHPVVSALTAAGSAGVSRQAAALALATLERRGVLVALDQPAPGRNPRERWWAATQVLDLLGAP